MIPEEAPPNYQVLFGGVVGQELANVTRDDKDVAAAIQVSLEHVYGKSTQHHHVKEVEKHVRHKCTNLPSDAFIRLFDQSKFQTHMLLCLLMLKI